MAVTQIDQIRDLFSRAETERDPEHKFLLFQEALDLVDDLDPSAGEEALLVAANLRRSNLHKLLLQLGLMRQIEIKEWFNFVRILMFRQKDLVEDLMASEPPLRTAYQGFLNLWWDELVAAVSAQQRGR